MILLISNGYGEDLIACNLIRALRQIRPEEEIRVIPLVGDGFAYQKLGLTPELQNAMFPSGGIIRTFKNLISDIKAGLFKKVLLQKKIASQLSEKAMVTICVGDVFCLWMGYRVEQKNLFFLATAKSDRFMPHSLVERFLIRIWAKQVFTRDSETAQSLQKKNIHAEFLGNTMLDYLAVSTVDYQFNKNQPVIGILPGSREEAYDNLYYILKIVENIYSFKPAIQYFFSKSDSLTYRKLVAKLDSVMWDLKEEGAYSVLRHREKGILVKISQNFGDFLTYASCVIGLAGTANEQAVYSQKPVICFEGFGPQSSVLRFTEQRKLLGDLLVFIPKRDMNTIIQTVMKYIDRPISGDLMGSLNASQKIISAILKTALCGSPDTKL